MPLLNNGVARQFRGTRCAWKLNAGAFALTICCALAVAPSPARAADSGHKRVIWWNSIKGPTEISAQDLDNLGQTFDGFIVQRVHGSQDTSGGAEFAWEAFTDRHYTVDPRDTSDDNISSSLTSLENLPPTPAPDRFLRVNASPYDSAHFDWGSDAFWNNVCSNLEVASQICAKAHLKGILLDTEPYHRGTSPNFYFLPDVQKDPRYAGVSAADLGKIIEHRGNQVIQALDKYDPDITVMVTFGYITVSQHITRANAGGSLLVPFLDGMLDGSSRHTTFVDAFEAGYWHNDGPTFFNDWAHAIKDPTSYNVRFQKYPQEYLQKYQFAVGLFLDRNRGVSGDSGAYGWCGDNKDNVFYSPARLAFTVQQAAEAADKYVWVYSQKPNAWLSPDSPGGLPSAYVHAIRDGMDHANNPSMSPLPQDNNPANESDVCK